jgi:hypothetical protein
MIVKINSKLGNGAELLALSIKLNDKDTKGEWSVLNASKKKLLASIATKKQLSSDNSKLLQSINQSELKKSIQVTKLHHESGSGGGSHNEGEVNSDGTSLASSVYVSPPKLTSVMSEKNSMLKGPTEYFSPLRGPAHLEPPTSEERRVCKNTSFKKTNTYT